MNPCRRRIGEDGREVGLHLRQDFGIYRGGRGVIEVDRELHRGYSIPAARAVIETIFIP